MLSFVGVWVLAKALGVKLGFPENNTPNPVESPVKSSEDIEKLEVPDPKKGWSTADNRGKSRAPAQTTEVFQ
jgi:uroporphyrinogen-III decarboxylase